MSRKYSDLSLVTEILLSDSEKYAGYVWGLYNVCIVTDSHIQRRQKNIQKIYQMAVK
jgi:hypothetical protein